MKRFLAVKAAVAAVCFVFLAAFSLPQAKALTLTTGAGWFADTLSNAGGNTVGSPLEFTLTGPSVFSLVDCCIVGDVWTVSGDAAGVSTFTPPATPITLGLGNTFFDSFWLNTTFSRLQILLGAGTYSLNLTGDGAGGFPAGVGVRVDSVTPVPLPASLPLLMAGLAGLGLMRRRKAT
jgi:hypothetical protein